MFDIIIIDGKKESFITLVNNSFIGFSLKNGISTFLQENDISILKHLKLGSNSIYLGKENNYDIYLDKNTKLKHFFTEEKEDILKFCQVNGEILISYDDSDKVEFDSEIDNSLFYKFNIYGKKVILALEIANLIVSGALAYNLVKDNKELSNYQQLNIEDISLEGLETISYNQICKYLMESSQLPDEFKKGFSNEDLLSDVLPYYENTNSSYYAHYKFSNLQIHKYKKLPKGIDERAIGWYSIANPNVINVLDCENNSTKEGYSDTVYHEYIHLLQSNLATSSYHYITEASAEIIKEEYFDYEQKTYQLEVRNLKLLMEIIGPEPIWKLNFSGDDSDLRKILYDNLDEEKAQTLIEMLGKRSSNTLDYNDCHMEIEKILNELYFNINNESVLNNPYISAMHSGELKDRYYFNDKLMEEKKPYVYSLKVVSGANIEIVKKCIFEKNLDYQEWLNMKDDNKILFFVKAGGILEGDKVLIDGVLYDYEEAIENDYIQIIYRDEIKLDDFNINEKCNYYFANNYNFRIESFIKVDDMYFNIHSINAQEYIENNCVEEKIYFPTINEEFYKNKIKTF